MPYTPTLSLIVIRVADINRSAQFYSALGLQFQHEQHGNGPEHFSTSLGDTDFELYPSTERFPVTSVRLGFTVDSIEAILEIWLQSDRFQNNVKILSEPKDSPWGVRAVVADLDGHRIELIQKTASSKNVVNN